MTAEVQIENAGKFQILYSLPKDVHVVVCIGSRGGRKTYEVSKFIAKSASIDKKRCVILRDEKELVRESILSDILARYDSANQYGHLDLNCERLETGIKDRKTGDMLVFTKGFRASNNEKRSNLKGVAQIDIAVVEEAEDIRNEEKFNTFHDSIRKQGSVVIIILNTPDLAHWILKRYFNAIPALDEKGNILEGFFEITPKNIPGFLAIQTSYLDNEFLPDHIVAQYEGYGNPESHLYNPFYFYTAIKGLASTGRKGQILTKVQPIKLNQYLALPFKEIYGQDFGTSSPAGLVGVKFDKNNCYCRQINYLPLDTLRIGKKYCELKLGKTDKIVGDSAEPKTIDRLSSGWRLDELAPGDHIAYPQLLKGFYIIPAVKGIGSIKAGIGLMTSMNLYAVEESTDLWNEIYNWIYAVDKNHQATDEPLDDFNHLIDPWRYVVQDHKGKPSFIPAGRFR